MKKKTILLIILAAVFLFIIIFVFCFPIIEFKLKGEDSIVVNYEEEYTDPGVEFKLFGIQFDSYPKMKGNVDTGKIGNYEVTYTYQWGFQSGRITRMVEVADLTPPVITASEDKVIYLEQGSNASLPSFSALDNVDGDVSSSIASLNYDQYYIGLDYILVQASDQAGNIGQYAQPVAIYNDDYVPSMDNVLKEGIYHMSIEGTNWVFRGYQKDQSAQTKLVLNNGKSDFSYDLVQLDTSRYGYYEATIDPSRLGNGTYTLYLVNGDERVSPSIVYYNTAQKLGRLQLGDKLVTFDYDSGLGITVDTFEYEYDIAIDVGHGDDDPGAIGLGNEYESDINLMVSLYEKQRYESFGLKVWLIREDDNYPELLGDQDWGTLQKVGWTTGYYGAVAKYTYSNHHNSDTAGVTSGPEIIVLPDLSKEDLSIAYTLKDKFKELYPVVDTKWTLFTRDYTSGTRYDRSNGTEYPDMRVYYANMRYPYEDFGVNVVTYEGCYLNNAVDYKWYITQEHWKDVSEAKIKAYVEALGITYTEP